MQRWGMFLKADVEVSNGVLECRVALPRIFAFEIILQMFLVFQSISRWIFFIIQYGFKFKLVFICFCITTISPMNDFLLRTILIVHNNDKNYNVS